MNGEADYSRLYHILNRRRGEEFRQLQQIADSVVGLMTLFEHTDRMVERFAINPDENGEV